MNENDLRERIKECEELGFDVVVVRRGKLDYSTQGMGGSDYCDQCIAFRLLPDPDPCDWFRDGDKMAVCLEIDGLIEGALEHPNEWTNIRKPLYCPKLGRKLSEEESKQATEQLKWAKEMLQLKRR